MQLSIVVEPPQRLIFLAEVLADQSVGNAIPMAPGKLRSLIPTKKFWQNEAKLANFSNG
jgi:hypothetical protein